MHLKAFEAQKGKAFYFSNKIEKQLFLLILIEMLHINDVSSTKTIIPESRLKTNKWQLINQPMKFKEQTKYKLWTNKFQLLREINENGENYTHFEFENSGICSHGCENWTFFVSELEAMGITIITNSFSCSQTTNRRMKWNRVFCRDGFFTWYCVAYCVFSSAWELPFNTKNLLGYLMALMFQYTQSLCCFIMANLLSLLIKIYLFSIT